jgi:hypothetical protein
LQTLRWHLRHSLLPTLVGDQLPGAAIVFSRINCRPA